jgi:hypothetical protein
LPWKTASVYKNRLFLLYLVGCVAAVDSNRRFSLSPV